MNKVNTVCDNNWLPCFSELFMLTGENCIVIVSGANMNLSCDDVYRAESLLANARVVVCQLEVTPNTTLTALKLARKHGGEQDSIQ